MNIIRAVVSKFVFAFIIIILALSLFSLNVHATTVISDLTFGYTSIGSSTQSIVNRISGSQFNASAAMRLASISVYLKSYTTDGSSYQGVKVKCSIYNITNTNPLVDSYIAETSEQTVLAVSPTWVTFTFPTQPAIFPNVNYSLYCWSNSGNLPTTVVTMYYNSLSFGGKYDDETYAAWHQPYMILYVENREYSIYATGANATYAFTFHGLYDESTGQQESDGVNVTATYQNGTAPSTFTVNGEYIFYSYESLPPLYFSFALSGGTREYWLSPTNIISNIYIFNATTLSQYHVTFIDLGNILSMSPYVEVDRNINGSMMAVEKQLVDKTLTINPLLVQNATYSLTLYDHNTYIIGNFVADGSSSIQIPITNIAFPNSVTLAYQYVRMYAERTTSQISMIYQDVTLDTLNVVFIITESNGNIVYTTTQYSDNLNVTWAVANESLTYFIKIDATTSDYGLLSYRNTLYPTSANSVNGFGLPLGKVNGLDLSVLFPTLILFCFALIFSQVNAHFGAIAVSGLAVFFAWFGWLPISSSMIVFALTMSVLYFLSARKRRDIFY